MTSQWRTETILQIVIYFVCKLLLSYRSFKAIAGCPPDSSSNRTTRQHTQRAARLWANCPHFITKTNGHKIRRIQTQWTIMCGLQCWRLTASLKQSRKQSLNSMNCFRLSGATYHKDRSTRPTSPVESTSQESAAATPTSPATQLKLFLKLFVFFFANSQQLTDEWKLKTFTVWHVWLQKSHL